MHEKEEADSKHHSFLFCISAAEKTQAPPPCHRVSCVVSALQSPLMMPQTTTQAPVSGSKQPAINGQLIILSAGDKGLYEEALPAFSKMGKKSLFLGAVGAGARMKLIVNSVMGCMMGTLCEGMSLADKAGLAQGDLLEVLSLGAIVSVLLRPLLGYQMAGHVQMGMVNIIERLKALKRSGEVPRVIDIDDDDVDDDDDDGDNGGGDDG
eukprot:1143981-Pelagomonas_calceolata.AAC.8